MKKEVFSKIFYIILLTIVSVLNIYASDLNFKYDYKIRKKYKNLLLNDIKFLKEFEFYKDPSPNTLKIFGLQQFKNDDVTKWLDDRVNYIIDDKDYHKLKIKTIDYFFPYENPNELPDVSEFIRLDLDENKGNEEKKLTVMSNIGTAIYYTGKMSQRLLGLKIYKSRFLKFYDIKVNSPRVGIIQIGEGLFNKKFLYSNKNHNSRANKFIRLSTLFHEARHSDGSGKSLGFLHQTCPKGHDYVGLKACDFSLNGPYTIGTTMMKELIKNCDNCEEDEKEILRLRAVDSASRVIKEIKTETSIINNDKINMLKNLLFIKHRLSTLKISDQERATLQNSIHNIKEKIKALEDGDVDLKIMKAEFLDPTPELNERE